LLSCNPDLCAGASLVLLVLLSPKQSAQHPKQLNRPTITQQTVYRGRWANTNVAIVRMRKGGTVTEARMMQELSGHPNLVQFYR